MSLRYAQPEIEYSLAMGMDITSSPPALEPGYVREAYNCDLGLSGGYVKRKGHANDLAAAWTGRSITAGIEYLTPAGAYRTVVHGTDGTATGGEIGYKDAGAVVSIVASKSGTARPSFVQIGTQLLWVNGADAPVVYNGTSTKQFGITAPSATPTGTASNGPGALVNSASYIHAYSHYNSATGAESTPTVLNAVVLGATDDTITYTGLTAAPAATADQIRIYRTVANGNQLFLEDTIAGASTAFTSVKADVALTTPAELDNSRVEDLADSIKYPAKTETRLFLATGDNEVRHSKVGQSGPMFESFEASAVASTEGLYGAADKIVGLGAAGDTPIVVKERSVGRLDALGVPDTLSPVDPVRYRYTEMSTDFGGVSHWAGCQVRGEWVFLTRENVAATDGRQLRTVADGLRTFIKACGFLSSQITKISAVNDTRNERVFFSVFVDELAARPDYILVGDYRRYPTFRWTIYRPGTNSNTHPGIRAGCFFLARNTANGHYNLYAGNNEANGQLYLLNSGDSDRGSGIYWYIKTRAYAAGRPDLDKLWKLCKFNVRGSGNNYSIQVSAIFDLSNSEVLPETISLAGSGALWDTAEWDTDTWADDTLLPKQYDSHRKAQFFQLVFLNSGADQPIELVGWSLAASLFRQS